MNHETFKKLKELRKIEDRITRRKEEFKLAIACKYSGEFATVREALEAFASV